MALTVREMGRRAKLAKRMTLEGRRMVARDAEGRLTAIQEQVIPAGPADQS